MAYYVLNVDGGSQILDIVPSSLHAYSIYFHETLCAITVVLQFLWYHRNC